MSDAASAYKTLDRQSQLEVDHLILKLLAKRENAVPKKKRSHSENLELVQSFMGKTSAWKEIDALEYQQQLRGEYRENV